MLHATPRLSVVVPAYNEGSGLGERIRELRDQLDENQLEAELVVVDDGSSDGSADTVAPHPGVRIVRHPRNLGYGMALKTGIRAAHSDRIAIIDADGTYPADALAQLTAAMDDGADMAVGARRGDNVHIPLVRRPAKWALRRLAEVLVGAPIPDLNSGLRIFCREDVQRYWHLLPHGFSFTSTITLCLLQDGARVDYHPINYGKRVGQSKIRPIRDTYLFLMLILRLVVYFNPIKVLAPLGILLVVAGIAVGVGSHLALGATMDVATSVLIFLGVQCFVLGLLADLVIARSRSGTHRDISAVESRGASDDD